MYVTVFTNGSPPLEPCPEPVESKPHFTLHFTNIYFDISLCSHLYLSLQSDLFLSGFPPKVLYVFLIFSCMLHVRHDFITLTIRSEDCKVPHHVILYNLFMERSFQQ
jgi:hypothetical protein